jgi:hypothetical protein
MNNNQEPQVLNFDGEAYNVEDLTPRAATEFNYLFRLQNELNELAYQLKKCQSAQNLASANIKNILKEDKIEAIEQPEAEEEKEVVLADEVKTKDKPAVN